MSQDRNPSEVVPCSICWIVNPEPVIYSRSVTHRVVALASQSQGWELQRHTPAQIRDAITHFDLLLNEEGSVSRPLTPEETRWISNERKLCALDFRYWVDRYSWIINWHKTPAHPTLNVAQEIILDLWAEHEERGIAIIIQHLKARQLGCCLHPRTLILTADLRWVPIEDLDVGQALVATEEFPREGRGAGRKLRVGWVEAIKKVHEPAYEIKFESGQVLVATGLHRFLCLVRGSKHSEWRDVRRTRAGDHIRSICSTWSNPSYEDGWIAGMFDGEGSVRQKERAGSELNVSQRPGPVYERARSYMQSRGYQYREEIDLRTPENSGKFGRNPVGKIVVSRLSDIFKLVGLTRPTRFLNSDWWEGKELPGKKIGQGWNKVMSIRPLGERTMIDLQTSTKTFIAEGFVSHNSTIYELACCHRFQFCPNSNIIIASADPKKTVEMGQMIKFCLDQQPWWLLPSSPNDVREKYMTVGFTAINTRLSIEAGNKFHGVARGGTPNVGHLTELSSWPDAAEDVDASFIRAVHEDANVFVGLESTALGRDNWWADTWDVVKTDWPRGRSRIRGEFLPWFVGTDIYPPASDLWRFRQMTAEGWEPNERTIHHAQRAREYVLANPLLFKHLAKSNPDWRMPIEQMWFYEIERETAQRKKTLNKFLSEMPADDQEAFQNSGRSVIDQDIILSYREQIQHPLGVYAIVGDGIYPSLIPPRNQWLTGPTAPPPITVRVSGVCRSTEVYQFIPLKFEGYPGFDPMFKLFIYEWPEHGEVYGQGVDTAGAGGDDWSVIEGFRKASPFRKHAQVYEFASPYIKSDQLWPMALALGSFYSVWNQKAQRITQSRICVECLGNGEIVQFELKKRGWVNFHPWKRYDNRRRTPNNLVHKEGVFTNQWFRAVMMDKLLTVIDEEAIDLHSPYLVNEMATLERDPDEASARAAYNTHDDRIMALGFPLCSLTIEDGPQVKRYRRDVPQYLPEALDDPRGNQTLSSDGYATWQPGLQSRSDVTQRIAVPVERTYKGLALGRVNNPHVPKGY